MKYFILNLTCQDGEHEHHYSPLIMGESEQAVRDYVEANELYDVDEDGKGAWCSFEDGQTAVAKYNLTPIRKAHYELMVKHGYKYEVGMIAKVNGKALVVKGLR